MFERWSLSFYAVLTACSLLIFGHGAVSAPSRPEIPAISCPALSQGADPAEVVGRQIFQKAYAELKAGGWAPIDGFETSTSSWPYDGMNSPLLRYTKAFSGLISQAAFQKMLKQKSLILDLFGSGFFALPVVPAKNIFGIRFEPSPSDIASEVPREILGDVFNARTWSNKLDRIHGADGLPLKFDLITMSPVGGWQIYNKNSSLQIDESLAEQLLREVIIGQALQRLSPQGVFLFRTSVSVGFETDLALTARLNSLVKLIKENTPYQFSFIIEKSGPYPIAIKGKIQPKPRSSLTLQ